MRIASVLMTKLQPLSAVRVAEIRKGLGLSQRVASQLLGGGIRAFQRYESGAVTVSGAMSNLLMLLESDPSRLDELRELQQRGSDAGS